MRLRIALMSLVPVTSQWVNGSFVTAKLDPSDLDLATLFDGVQYDALVEIKKKAAGGLLAGPRCQPIWGCDSYPIAVYPAGHPKRARFEAALRYWDKWWGRTSTGQKKGYLEVQ